MRRGLLQLTGWPAGQRADFLHTPPPPARHLPLETRGKVLAEMKGICWGSALTFPLLASHKNPQKESVTLIRALHALHTLYESTSHDELTVSAWPTQLCASLTFVSPVIVSVLGTQGGL